MNFEIGGEIQNIETIARGPSVRERMRLTAQFGRGRWRKLKGTATVRLRDGWTGRAEKHWYEAHGVGRRKIKISVSWSNP
jgi:hypothetical protein